MKPGHDGGHCVRVCSILECIIRVVGVFIVYPGRREAPVGVVQADRVLPSAFNTPVVGVLQAFKVLVAELRQDWEACGANHVLDDKR